MEKQYIDKHATDYVRDNLIFNYCLGNEDEIVIESYIHNNDFNLGFDHRNFYFLMTGIHNKLFKPVSVSAFNSGVANVIDTYQALLSALQNNGYTGHPFQIKEDNSKQIGVLFSPSSSTKISPDQMAVILLESFLQVYNKSILHNFRSYLSTSFVGPYSGYNQIHQAFLDARELNDLIFFGVRGTIITKEYRDKSSRPCDVTAVLGNVRRLITTICTGTLPQALRQTDYIIRDMIAPSYTMSNFSALFSAIDDLLGMLEIVYPQYIRITRHAQDSFFTLEDYHIWLRKTITTIFDQLSDVQRYSPTILMALSYINRNYVRELSLIQLSEYVYANASVLSSEFNNEVGMSLSEYVTGLRVQKAQQLLSDTDMTVPQIAEAAGFSSAKYFREIFKKQTGMSPQQYRDGH